MIDYNFMFFKNPTLPKILFLLFFSIFTILFFNHYDRYIVVGPELIQNPDFSQGNGWKQSSPSISLTPENQGMALLTAHSQTEAPSLSQTLPVPGQSNLLRLSCDIKTKNIIAGNKYWKSARVVMLQRNSRGEPMYSLPHILASQQTDSDWQHFEKAFIINPTTAEVLIAAELVQSSGSMWIKSLSLRPIAVKASFKEYRLAILLVWLAALIWIGRPIILSWLSHTRGRIALVLATGILIGVLLPENLKELLSGPLPAHPGAVFTLIIPNQFNNTDFFRFTPLLPSIDIYKIGHFSMFMLLAVTLFGAKTYRDQRTQLIGYLILFALSTEVLQLFMAGRTAQLGDVIVDSLGIMLGVFITTLRRQ